MNRLFMAAAIILTFASCSSNTLEGLRSGDPLQIGRGVIEDAKAAISPGTPSNPSEPGPPVGTKLSGTNGKYEPLRTEARYVNPVDGTLTDPNRSVDPNAEWLVPGNGRFLIRSVELGYVCIGASFSGVGTLPAYYRSANESIFADYCTERNGSYGWKLQQASGGVRLADAETEICLSTPDLNSKLAVDLGQAPGYLKYLHTQSCGDSPKLVWNFHRVGDAFVIQNYGDPRVCLQTMARAEFTSSPDPAASDAFGFCPDVSSGHVAPNFLFSLDTADPALQAQLAELGHPTRLAGVGVPDANASTEVRACDRLAANPSDPQRKDQGVVFERIQVKKAIAACSAAVNTEPNSLRLSYQLARATLRVGVDPLVTSQLKRLDAYGYAAASHSLGLMADEDGQHGTALRYFLNGAQGQDIESMIALAAYHIVNGATSTGRAWLALAEKNGSSRARDLDEHIFGAQLLNIGQGDLSGETMPVECRVESTSIVSGTLPKVDLDACFPNGLDTPIRGWIGFALRSYG